MPELSSSVTRVALFIPGFGGGGAENVFIHLANYWSSIGVAVDFLVLNNDGPMKERLSSKVVVRRLDGGGSQLLRRFRIARAIAHFCQTEEPQILFSTLTYCNLSAVAAKRFWSLGATRLVLREANSLDNIRKGRALSASFTLRAIRILYHHADAITANSEHTLQQLVEETGVPRARCHLIRNPVPEVEAEDQYCDHEDLPVVLGCGRLIPQKDFETLISAVAEVRKSLNCRLVILGDGPERERLQDFASNLGFSCENFELVGFVSNPHTFYKRASVFALASKWEGLPNVVLEALSVGLPVVATDCSGGTREIFAGVENTHLVQVGDIHQMAAKIKKFIVERPAQEQMKKLVYPQYALDRIAQCYLDL